MKVNKVFIFYIQILLPLIITAQPQTKDPHVSKNLLYNRIHLVTIDTEIIGFFTGSSADSLFVISDGTRKRFAINDLEMVKFFMEKDNRSKNLWVTTLLGIHLGNVAFNQVMTGSPLHI